MQPRAIIARYFIVPERRARPGYSQPRAWPASGFLVEAQYGIMQMEREHARVLGGRKLHLKVFGGRRWFPAFVFLSPNRPSFFLMFSSWSLVSRSFKGQVCVAPSTPLRKASAVPFFFFCLKCFRVRQINEHGGVEKKKKRRAYTRACDSSKTWCGK